MNERFLPRMPRTLGNRAPRKMATDLPLSGQVPRMRDHAQALLHWRNREEHGRFSLPEM